MPRALATADELGSPSIALNQEVRGNAHTGQQIQERVQARLERIAKEPLDTVRAEVSRRQADVVQDEQLDRHRRGTLVAVSAGHLPHTGDPPVGSHPKRQRSHYFKPSRCIR